MRTASVYVAMLLISAIAAVASAQQAPPIPPPAAPAVQNAPAAPQQALPAPATAPAARVARPTTAVDPADCVSAQCHAEVKQYKFIHGPVNVNGCDACHKLVDVKAHKYELARPKTETCSFCHKIDTTGMAVVHKPVTEGNCDGCHNPHGGNTRAMLRGKTMNETCAACHKDPLAGMKYVHGPAAAGACDACHKPHASPLKNLLVVQGRDLCFSCHTEMKTQMARVKFRHKAVEGDCVTCHDPHASNFVMQTRQEPLQLCTSCHEHDKIKTAAMDAPHKHPPVTQDKACLNCHTAHGGELASLMRAEPATVCLKCHDKDIKSADGKTVLAASVAEVKDPKMVKHGPIRDGNCGGCHEPHGSKETRLLAKPYPETFYQAFSLDKYELCFSCHDKQLVLAEKAQGLTGFRNGDENLHFVHVNKSDRGRNCRACHETHASPQPLHVRASVPYGNWKLPINFIRTEDGGSCSPGCHRPYRYDRKNPVDNQTAAPTSAPAPAAQPPAPALATDGSGGKASNP